MAWESPQGPPYRELVEWVRICQPQDAAHEKYATGETLQEAYVTAICLGQTRERVPESRYPFAKEWKEILLPDDLDGSADVLGDAHIHVRNVIRHLKGMAFVTTSQGRVGLAPAATRLGDMTAVILGCSTPMILRPVNSNTGFQVIGACYIHGLMDAEALLGRLPEPWRFQAAQDASGVKIPSYLNSSTGEVIERDPRLEETSEWERMPFNRTPDDPFISWESGDGCPEKLPSIAPANGRQTKPRKNSVIIGLLISLVLLFVAFAIWDAFQNEHAVVWLGLDAYFDVAGRAPMPGVIEERLAGCIKWLPRRNELVPADPDIEEGCCHHPVVILSTRPRDTRVEILIITSFGGVDLAAKFPTHESARLDHLPIAPSKTHPDNGILLLLENPTDKLRKNSWVKTGKQLSIRLRSLQPYDRRGPDIFLSRRSYRTLVHYVQFSEPQPEPAVKPPSYALVPERPLRAQPSTPAYDVESIVSYYQRWYETNRIANHSPTRPHISSNIITTRAERQPLLPTTSVRPQPPTTIAYPPRHYGHSTTAPTAYPVQQHYGRSQFEPSSWAAFGKFLGILWCICLVLFISYELYLNVR
ncbi:hypothetical protein O1611_g3969 [Lasiodiplodia mahajangana]|uniref:Uncharacterized protein n=1 Tax=Lasiodiplodia mahajangana TaxID=1108764 RepID=A0ACC2JQP2_9PEZI|nr:hypothetical protein O1611_g3969 [Lasiodiplodia mahajangana]